MQTASFYGSSDDLVEVEGIRGADEFDGDVVNLIVGGVLMVTFIYVTPGVWQVGVRQVFNDVPIPGDWNILILPHSNGYSPKLVVQVPDAVGVVQACV